MLVSGAPLEGCAAADVDRNALGDIVDIGLVTGHWGLSEGDPDWEPIYDLVVNGVIDVADVIAVADCWGWLPDPNAAAPSSAIARPTGWNVTDAAE